MRNLVRYSLLTIICPLLLTASCTTVRQFESGTKWEDNALFLIKPGKTTAKEIAYGFGSPQKEIVGTDGRIWIYYNNSAKYLYDAGIRVGIIEGVYYSLIIWFDSNGVVTNRDLSYREYIDPDLKKRADKLERRQMKGVAP